MTRSSIINYMSSYENAIAKSRYINITNNNYSFNLSLFMDTAFINPNTFTLGFKYPQFEYPKPTKLNSTGDSSKEPFSKESLGKIKAISVRLNCRPEDLKALILSESGGNSAAQNKSGATGLIQFMPSIAKEFGTTTNELKKMPAEEQLDYVEKYLASRKSNVGFKKNDKLDASTLYCLVLCPSYAKKGSQEALYVKGSKNYSANKGLDKDRDGKITKIELAQRIDNKLKEYCV